MRQDRTLLPDKRPAINMMRMLLEKKRGFTLVELLVVISIIGILASIITASLANAKAGGRDAKRISDLKNIQLGLGLYYNDNYKFPVTLSLLVSGGYISIEPKDPSTQNSYLYSAVNANGSVNCTTNPATKYHLGAVMEVTTSSFLLQDNDDSLQTSGTYGVCTGSGAKFHGMATNCSGTTAAGTDNCYDVVDN